MVEVKTKVENWLKSPAVDASSKEEIKKMMDNDPEKLTDSFYKDLDFGTGGLRGIMGVGTNRMNKYTVGMATQGLSNYLKKTFLNTAVKVAIAYDSRHNSRFFANTAAEVFSANDIEVHLFNDLRPTPQLSFVIRKLECQSGIVITASHNPKEYNGYKAYWDDGAQIIAPHDKNIIEEVRAVSDVENVEYNKKEELIHNIGDEIDSQYIDMVCKLTLSPDAVAKNKALPIVFSGIHGTGNVLVPRVLRKIGFENIHQVEEQASADGNFPTVVYPNPEEAEALKLALAKAEEVNADLVMATDPDADRVGIAVKNTKGKLQLLNGNQTGALIIYYLLTKWKENGKLTGNQFIVKTIVTTDLIKKIADDFGVISYETLTGFKFIAALIKELEGREQFIGGGEESYGYLIGDAVRDKDAVASCAIIAEMAAWAKTNGKTLFQILIEISHKYGLYKEGLRSIKKEGKKGADEIKTMMEGFRATPPKILGGEQVTMVMDYARAIATDLVINKESAIKLPKSNVLQFITKKGSKISIRPSGTEPKIKFYCSINEKFKEGDDFHTCQELLEDRKNRLLDDLIG